MVEGAEANLWWINKGDHEWGTCVFLHLYELNTIWHEHEAKGPA